MKDFRLPRMWTRLLAWLLDDEWEVVVGDFQEFYQEIAFERGHAAARRAFRMQVLALVPGRLARKASQHALMLQNYLLLGVRNLKKERVASGINIFGLSVAVGCSITVYLFLNGYLNMNADHPLGDRIFVVEQVLDDNGQRRVRGTSPLPLGPALAAESPEVQRVIRTTGRGVSIRASDTSFEEWITFAEPGFLDLFHFPMAQGTQDALKGGDGVVLSHTAARRHFGDRNPVGETINVILGFERTISLTVTAVAERFPSNAGVQFSVLAHIDRLLDAQDDDWGQEVRATYIQLLSAADAAPVGARLATYLDRTRAANPDLNLTGFRLENLVEPSPDAWLTDRRFAEAPHPAFVWTMASIPLFMIALACFNYINIALGSASRRLREIGVRKAMGGSRTQLVYQFLGENVILCGLALLLGLLISFAFLTPLFNSVFVNQIVFRWTDVAGLTGFLAALLLSLAVVSGIYPALYVSSFDPVRVLRGRLTLDSRRWLTKTLLTCQFILAFLTVILSIYLTRNGRHIVDAEWGYDPAGTVAVALDSGEQFRVMRDAASQLSGAVSVSGSRNHIGASSDRVDMQIGGERTEIIRYHVGADYLKTMGLTLVDGRDFDADHAGDVGTALIVNRAFHERHLSGANPPPLRLDDTEYTVVGVVDDFHIWFAVQDREAVFSRSTETDHRFLTVRTAPGQEANVLGALEEAWINAFPAVHFNGFRQAEVFDDQYRSYRNVVQAFSYLAILALLVACMGLFGLANQNAARRLKEVSIRKVLGASMAHITLVANRGFAVMLTVAAVVAAVAVYIPFRVLMETLPVTIVHLPLGVGVFLSAYILVLFTASLSVALQARRLARAAPVDALRVD